ncbi:hypothetical protein NL676_037656 [Syzygium grande]|nr:hypothetical protein NL676_037656 [Syzygium grande]
MPIGTSIPYRKGRFGREHQPEMAARAQRGDSWPVTVNGTSPAIECGATDAPKARRSTGSRDWSGIK